MKFNDLLQEGVLAAIEKMDSYREDLAKFSTFLWITVESHYRNLNRKFKLKNEVLFSELEVDTESPFSLGEQVLEDKNVDQTVLENEVMSKIKRELSEEEFFAFNCYFRPPSGLWKLAREFKQKSDKRRGRKSQNINLSTADILRYLESLKGKKWASKILRKMRQKVFSILTK